MEIGSLDQIAEESATEVEALEAGNSAEQPQTPAAAPAQPSAPAEATPAGEVKPAAEPAQPAAEPQETFTHIDPKTLSPELQQVYKSLQADYTRKRQLETQKIRDLETKLASQGQQPATQTQVPAAPDSADFLGQLGITEEQLAKMSLPEYTAKVLEAAKQGVQIETEQKNVEAFESQATVDFLSMDARLNPEVTGSFEPRMASWVAGEMDKAYQQHIEDTGSPIGFDHKTTASKLINDWDTWIETQLKTKIEQTTKAAQNKANKHLRQAPPGTQAKSTVTDVDSLDDAIEASLDEQD